MMKSYENPSSTSTLRPTQNGCHFADGIFKLICMYAISIILIHISYLQYFKELGFIDLQVRVLELNDFCMAVYETGTPH